MAHKENAEPIAKINATSIANTIETERAKHSPFDRDTNGDNVPDSTTSNVMDTTVKKFLSGIDPEVAEVAEKIRARRGRHISFAELTTAVAKASVWLARRKSNLRTLGLNHTHSEDEMAPDSESMSAYAERKTALFGYKTELGAIHAKNHGAMDTHTANKKSAKGPKPDEGRPEIPL
jgi:hypothetical protein